jgi:hypothetical protein
MKHTQVMLPIRSGCASPTWSVHGVCLFLSPRRLEFHPLSTVGFSTGHSKRKFIHLFVPQRGELIQP